jgi:hypothetical protein
VSEESEEKGGKMLRITPSVYARIKIAAKRDGRSIAKEVDFACKQYLKQNHPDLTSSDDEDPPKKS